MPLTASELALLHACFSLARDGRRPSLAHLSAEALVPRGDALTALAALRRHGLVQERALRLTLSGLALAVAAPRRARRARLVAAA